MADTIDIQLCPHWTYCDTLLLLTQLHLHPDLDLKIHWTTWSELLMIALMTVVSVITEVLIAHSWVTRLNLAGVIAGFYQSMRSYTSTGGENRWKNSAASRFSALILPFIRFYILFQLFTIHTLAHTHFYSSSSSFSLSSSVYFTHLLTY